MQLLMKFTKPIENSNLEQKTTGSIQPEHSAPQISVTRPNQFRVRYAIKFGSRYLGVTDLIDIKLFTNVERAKLFMTSERAWLIAKDLPELGGIWTQRTEYDVVPVYVPDPVLCYK